MTTTQLFSGLEADAKSSSRVLRPPGGASSNIFGDPEPVANRPAPQGRQDNGVFGATPTAAAGVAPALPTNTPPVSSHDNLFGGSDADKDTPSKNSEEEEESNNNPQEESNAAAGNDALPRGGYNPITGEAYGAGAAGASNNPSTRVRQPPGGAASKLW